MQLVDDHKEKRVYRKLEEETQECTVGRRHFGRGYRPVIRQTMECTEYTCTHTHTLTPQPLQCRGQKQSRAIPLLSLKAFVAYDRAKPTYILKIPAFWDMMSCCWASSSWHFKGSECFVTVLCGLLDPADGCTMIVQNGTCTTNRVTQHHIQEEWYLHQHHFVNLSSCIVPKV